MLKSGKDPDFDFALFLPGTFTQNIASGYESLPTTAR
jgi:hypothetical protein